MSIFIIGGVAVVGMAIYLLSHSKKIMSGPMGLVQKDPKEHGVVDLKDFDTFESCISKKYSLKQTLQQKVKKFPLVFVSKRSGIGWKHFKIIWNHESRFFGRGKAFFVSIVRWLAFFATNFDCFEEVYVKLDVDDDIWPPKRDKLEMKSQFKHCEKVERFTLSNEDAVDESRFKLVAFASSIVKGDTIRAMWYYSEMERANIYYYIVRLNFLRAYCLNLRYVDAGPSDTHGREAKEKLGFVFTKDYQKFYEGDFKKNFTVSELLKHVSK